MMRGSYIFSIFFLLAAVRLVSAEPPVRRFDFDAPEKLKTQWVAAGKQFGVPLTKFSIVRSAEALKGRALAVEARSSSGVLVTRIPGDVWEKYPVVRWRWRVLRKVNFTGKEPDDQAAVIYFGDGSMLKQFAVAYRWEHSLPLGDESEIRYGMGATIVRRICMRNKNAVPGKWYVEERNVVEDFKRAFGRLPEGSCGLTIGANSQYSKSNTLVEIDFIEFCAGGKEVPLPLPEGIKTAERKDDR